MQFFTHSGNEIQYERWSIDIRMKITEKKNVTYLPNPESNEKPKHKFTDWQVNSAFPGTKYCIHKFKPELTSKTRGVFKT